MIKVCVKCKYVRQPSDTAPDYECPKCGVIYAKAEAALRGIQTAPPQDPPKSGIHFDEIGGGGLTATRVGEIKKTMLLVFIGAAIGGGAIWALVKPSKQAASTQPQQVIVIRQPQALSNLGPQPSSRTADEPKNQAEDTEIKKTSTQIEPQPAAPIDRKKELEKQVTQEIRGKLKDPDSAQFRNIRVAFIERRRGSGATSDFDEEIVCGEVNAKNAFGGYIGFSPFVWLSKASKYDGTGKPYLWMMTGDKDLDYVTEIAIRNQWKECQ
jgi:hypothetical protein